MPVPSIICYCAIGFASVKRVISIRQIAAQVVALC